MSTVIENIQKRPRRSKEPEYNVWINMIYRCHNPKSPAYKHYGGRGIVVCDAWRESYEQFVSDVGRRSSPQHTIDRINNELGYLPGNVRWAASMVDQNRNRRDNRLLTINGDTYCVREWEERAGLNRHTIHYRLKAGEAVDVNLLRPARTWKRS